MSKPLAMLVIGFFFGAGFGYLAATAANAPLHDHAHDHGDHGPAVHDHSAHDHSAHDHDHAAMTEAGVPAPEVRIVLHPDGRQSRNLEIVTTNFTFDPVGVNGAHRPGHGHAHVYLDGVKITRAYGPWLHLDALPVGRHQLRVTLNANDHTTLAHAGRPIEATAELVIE
ncbi:MAG: hypothetical protein Kow0058_06120 [Roseovarius sp.]